MKLGDLQLDLSNQSSFLNEFGILNSFVDYSYDLRKIIVKVLEFFAILYFLIFESHMIDLLHLKYN